MLSVIIPTYNEKENIALLVEQIGNSVRPVTEYEILVVDDSTDDTPKVLKRLSDENPNFRYVHRDGKNGLASAVVLGFELASGDIIAVMDADFQHPPSLLVPMLEALDEGADMVLPSRYIGGGDSEGLSAVRKLASRSAAAASKLLLKSMKNVSDPMSGFFMLRSKVIEGVKFRPIGWKILMEVLTLGNYSHVAEISYGFENRRSGESKLGFRITVQYFFHILSLMFRSERERRFYAFILASLSGVLVDMLFFVLITLIWTLNINTSAAISGLAAMIASYIFNRYITFRSTRSSYGLSECLKYLLVSSICLAIKNFLILFISATRLEAFWCNLAGILTASLFSYFLSRKWVFHADKDEITYTVIDRAKEKESAK